MSVDPFIVHGYYPNDNPNNREFNSLFLQKTFLCMERLNEIKKNNHDEKLSFDCKEYKTIEHAISKISEEKNNNRRTRIVQIPSIISESLIDKVLYYHLREQYWGNVKRI
jgi:hypothetical protein